MKRFHFSLARTMAIVAVLAVDCALLATFSAGRTFYPEMLLFVPVLQIGLFRLVPTQGRVRHYWVGFELFGWAAVLAWYLGLSWPMGRCFDYCLSHLVSYLAKHHTGLFHLLRPLFEADDLLMGVIAIFLWGAVVSSPLVVIACLGGRLAAIRDTRRSRIAAVPD
jgi:hypothetical protein